jgi:hypothetical protein
MTTVIPASAEAQLPRIVFNAPDGREVLNPSRESLRELVLGKGDDYWARGGGDAAVMFTGPEGGSRLILIGHEPEGFVLLYEAPTGEYSIPTLSSATEEQNPVTVYVGGEPMEVPRQNVLAKEAAWRVIADFLLNGQRSPQVKWDPWL